MISAGKLAPGFHLTSTCEILVGVKKLAISCLCVALCATPAMPLQAAYGDDNPFVEAMLRMMEVMGLIDRGSLPLGVPYLPGYSPTMMSGMGGYPMMGPGMAPGMSPGMGMVPGMSPMSPWSGMGQFPGTSMWQGGGLPNASGMPFNGWTGRQNTVVAPENLDGAWELTNGSFVLIKGRKARLYVSKEKHQDFTIGYDRQTLWWTPKGGNTTSHYRYQERDGRMVLRDNKGKTLLLRRRQ